MKKEEKKEEKITFSEVKKAILGFNQAYIKTEPLLKEFSNQHPISYNIEELKREETEDLVQKTKTLVIAMRTYLDWD